MEQSQEEFQMGVPQTMQDKIERGAQDAGVYFRSMAQFVGFDKKQADAIYESRYIIEKHIPDIVAEFYTHLLKYPGTRKFFLSPDQTINHEYVQFRMSHLANFWRRTAYGPYDDDFARYVDYVGLAHTKRGADPHIDIAEHYVIGQVGFMQHAISEAISKELHEIDPEWEVRALKAWNLLMTVILQLLVRVYQPDGSITPPLPQEQVDPDQVKELAVGAYERGVGMHHLQEVRQTFFIGQESEIPIGERKLVKIMGLSIGIFHHPSGWYALQNKCLHAGGPVAEGRLRGDVLTCPWHGFQYNLCTGGLLDDPHARLEMYPVEIIEGQVFVKLPIMPAAPADEATTSQDMQMPTESQRQLAKNEFRLSELKPGGIGVVEVNGESAVVFNVAGEYYALDDYCPHAGAPLSEGTLEEKTIICPWHGSCFDVTTGAVLCGPAREGVKTFTVHIDGEIGRVE
jgi:3-phenylpropionate/trans-cinnamate dioxygenase ferredoxin component